MNENPDTQHLVYCVIGAGNVEQSTDKAVLIVPFGWLPKSQITIEPMLKSQPWGQLYLTVPKWLVLKKGLPLYNAQGETIWHNLIL